MGGLHQVFIDRELLDCSQLVHSGGNGRGVGDDLL